MSQHEYTPTTEEVRRDYAHERDVNMYSPSFEKERAFREGGGGAGEFDRWLTEHDQTIIAEKLEEMAAQWREGEYVKAYLLGEAQFVRAAVRG